MKPIRILFLCLCCLAVGFGTGALSYRYYFLSKHFRDAPDETDTRPFVDAPDDGAASVTASAVPTASCVVVQSDVIRLTPHASGSVIWEAEWANRVTGSFACLGSKDAAGDAALWAREGTGRNNGARFVTPRKSVDLGVADWYIDLPQAGAYRLFMRVWALDQCGNSCWVGFDTTTKLHYFPGGDAGAYGAAHFHWPESMYRRWLWIDDEGSTYNLAAGAHRLHIEVREDGFAIDQIALVPVGSSFTPTGILASTLVPGQGHLPNDVALRHDVISNSRNGATTPLDAFLAMDRYALSADPQPETGGWIWLRLNANVPTVCSVTLAAAGAECLPGYQLQCVLTPEQPVARVPFRVRFPATAAHRAYDVKMKCHAAAFPDLSVQRSCRVARMLDWWAMGPLRGAQDRNVGVALKDSKKIDVTRSPLPKQPTLAWVRLDPETHYDAFGALDLNKLFGPQTHAAAYIVNRFRVEKDGVYDLRAAGDDSLRLRIDGRVVVSEKRHAPITDSIRSYRISLKAGDHVMVGRVEQRSRWWQAFIEFRNLDGSPAAITGLPMLLGK